MGVVYRYYDEKLDRFLAVKSLTHEFSRHQQWRERFLREAKTLASLVHPNIGAIFDVLNHQGDEFLLLEYVPGRTLAEELACGPMPIERALSLGVQIAGAIDAGHASGIIHGDIKPGNIMITPADVAKLLDYGLARHRVTPAAQPGVNGQTAETATVDMSAVMVSNEGTRMGTPGYMSPEQMYGAHVGRPADIWALGCVLFECLSGMPAFGGSTKQDRITAVLNAQPRWDALARGVPSRIVDLLKSCLEKDPQRRPTDISAMMRTLRSETLAPAALLASVSTPHNIPAPLSSFVGRRGEMQILEQLLNGARLLTLTGSGGAGKTRLATEFARHLLARTATTPSAGFSAGLWLIELAPLSSGDLIARTAASIVCRTRTVEPGSSRTPMQLLAHELGHASALLVLDNCEHMVEESAAFVREALSQCENLKIIATSRAALGVKGEQTYRVPELSYPAEAFAAGRESDLSKYEALRLFAERARLARSDFSLDAGNAPIIADICRQLEGVPLAIELAAARVASMPLPDLSKRLLKVLDPNRVLESSIQWSVKLLTPPERTLLSRLAVFRGGWTLDAAESVCGDGDGTKSIRKKPVVELLGQLVDKSLVLYQERDARARYHMLETVREFSHEHLWKNGRTTNLLVRKHMEFFAALAHEADANLTGPDQAAWLNRLETERDNLRAAIDVSFNADVPVEQCARFVCDLRNYWVLRGYASEGRLIIERTLARRSSESDLLQAQLLNAMGILAGRQRCFKEAIQYCQTALRIVEKLGDARRIAGVLTNLGLWSFEIDDLESSRAFHQESLSIYASIVDSAGTAMAKLNLGDVLLKCGEFEKARHLLDEALKTFERAGDRHRVAGALFSLGRVGIYLGEGVNATQSFSRSLELRLDFGDKKSICRALQWLGISLCGTAAYKAAARCFGAADEIAREVNVCIEPRDAVHYERAMGGVRANLDSHLLEEEWNSGRRLARDRTLYSGKLIGP